MPRFTGVEFGFENEHKAERHSPGEKTGLPPTARPVPTTVDPWLDTNAMPRYRAEARGGNKLMAVGLVAIAIAIYVGISWFMEWGVWR